MSLLHSEPISKAFNDPIHTWRNIYACLFDWGHLSWKDTYILGRDLRCGSYHISSSRLYIKNIVLPLRISLCINLFVVVASRSSLASSSSSIAIQSKQQTFWMYIFWQGCHSRRKSLLIGYDFFGCLISICLPAIIDVDVFVTFCSQTWRDQKICCFFDDSLIDVAAVVIPGVPTHRWSLSKPIIKCPDANQQECN